MQECTLFQSFPLLIKPATYHTSGLQRAGQVDLQQSKKIVEVSKRKEINTHLNRQACAELISNVTVSPTRGQELLLDLGESRVELGGTVDVKSSVLHTLESHACHGVSICSHKKSPGPFLIQMSHYVIKMLLLCHFYAIFSMKTNNYMTLLINCTFGCKEVILTAQKTAFI